MLDKVKKYNNSIQEQDITEVDEVMIYGDVELNEEERSLLNLGPGFMVTAPLDSEEMQVEAVVTLTKLRWGRRGRGTEDMTDNEIALEEKEKGLDKLEEEESIAAGIQSVARDVISEDEKSIRMGSMRATDMKNNREVCMPGPAPPSVEAALNTRMGVWQECYDRYKRKNCNKKGAQIKSNLTLGQEMAMKLLGKRVAKAEIAILEADKGKRFVVVDMDTYVSMAMDHTSKDVEVTREELHTHQRILSSTAKALVNALGTGVDQSHRNYVRCVDNAGSEAEDTPVMRVLPKVHKGLTTQGHPHSRPVVNAATGMSSRAGDVVSDFLEPLVLLLCPRMEDRSTEEAIHQLEEAEEGLRKSGSTNAMVGSLDVAALYPSIDQEQAADMVAMTIQESPVKMEGINLRCLQVYLFQQLDGEAGHQGRPQGPSAREGQERREETWTHYRRAGQEAHEPQAGGHQGAGTACGQQPTQRRTCRNQRRDSC